MEHTYCAHTYLYKLTLTHGLTLRQNTHVFLYKYSHISSHIHTQVCALWTLVLCTVTPIRTCTPICTRTYTRTCLLIHAHSLTHMCVFPHTGDAGTPPGQGAGEVLSVQDDGQDHPPSRRRGVGLDLNQLLLRVQTQQDHHPLPVCVPHEVRQNVARGLPVVVPGAVPEFVVLPFLRGSLRCIVRPQECLPRVHRSVRVTRLVVGRVTVGVVPQTPVPGGV